MAVLPVVLILVFVASEGFTAIQTIETISNAARTGARVASQKHTISACAPAARAVLPAWLVEMRNPDDHLPRRRQTDPKTRAWVWGVQEPTGAMACHVLVKIPLMTANLPFNYTVERTVRMPG